MPDHTLDAIDRRILDVLQEDARISNVELAARISLSPSPCLRRVRMLEDSGIVRRYVTLLDPVSVGLGVAAFIDVRLHPKTAEVSAGFERAIQRFSEVMECHIMSGDYDYLLRVVSADIAALRNFIMTDLLAIPGVDSTRSSFSLGEVKYTTALPLLAQ